MMLHIIWLSLHRATPLLGKEGLGVVDSPRICVVIHGHHQPPLTPPFQGGGLVCVHALTT